VTALSSTSTQSDILAAIRRVKPQFPGARFILFGSRARAADAVRPDSDLDVYVVFPELITDPFELIYQIRTALHAQLDLALDVLVADRARFEQRAASGSTLEHSVQLEGLTI
jgi:predicted nucleotidyltransferase